MSGTYDKAMGNVKETLGNAFGSHNMQAEGAAQAAKGEAKSGTHNLGANGEANSGTHNLGAKVDNALGAKTDSKLHATRDPLSAEHYRDGHFNLGRDSQNMSSDTTRL